MLIITSMAFGENLRKLRKEKGLSQQELAKKAGVSQQVIGHYEKGIRAPKLEQAILVAKALGMSVEEIYGQLERRKPAAATPHRHKNTRAAKMEEVFELLPADKQKAILDHAKALLKQ
jgi:transcriptional regulator with XRE-family HTH domain